MCAQRKARGGNHVSEHAQFKVTVQGRRDGRFLGLLSSGHRARVQKEGWQTGALLSRPTLGSRKNGWSASWP